MKPTLSGSARLTALRLRWLLLLSFLPLSPSLMRGADEIQLPPIFSDNMVLQRGARNVIWGKAIWDKNGPKKQYVSIAYQNAVYWSDRMRSSEDWQVEMDLLGETNSYLGPLVISMGPKKSEQHVVLTLANVAIGDVYLLDVLGKGVPTPRPKTPNELADLTRKLEFVRLATITNINSSAGSSTRVPAWHTCSPDATGFEELSALSYCWAVQLQGLHLFTKCYIGIIQTRTNELVSSLGESSWQESLEANRKAHLDKINFIRHSAHIPAADLVERAERDRKQRLISAKHAGIAINPPPLFQYNFPQVFLREAFEPKAFTNFRNFDAAIW